MVRLEDVEHITLPAGSCKYDYLLAVCKFERGFEEDDNDEYYLRDVYLDDGDNADKIPSTGKKDDERIVVGEPEPAVSKVDTMAFGGLCLSRLKTVVPKKPRTTRRSTPESGVSSSSGGRDGKGLELDDHSLKRKRKRLMHGEISNKRSSCRRRDTVCPELPPPGLPAEFKNLIRQLAGNRPVSAEKLVIQKQLTETDVNSTQNRLSIPTKHVIQQFLTDEEYAHLCMRDGKNVGSIDGVPLITPAMESAKVSLRRWEMRKATGPPSTSFVLTNTWNKIRAQIQLRSGMTVQLWAFRVDVELWFALVRLT